MAAVQSNKVKSTGKLLAHCADSAHSKWPHLVRSLVAPTRTHMRTATCGPPRCLIDGRNDDCLGGAAGINHRAPQQTCGHRAPVHGRYLSWASYAPAAAASGAPFAAATHPMPRASISQRTGRLIEFAEFALLRYVRALGARCRWTRRVVCLLVARRPSLPTGAARPILLHGPSVGQPI